MLKTSLVCFAALMLAIVVVLPVAPAVPTTFTFTYTIGNTGAVSFVGAPPTFSLTCPGGWQRESVSSTTSDSTTAFSVQGSVTGSVDFIVQQGGVLAITRYVCALPNVIQPDVLAPPPTDPPISTPANSVAFQGWHSYASSGKQIGPASAFVQDGLFFDSSACYRSVATPEISPAQIPFTGAIDIRVLDATGTAVLDHTAGVYLAGIGPWDFSTSAASASNFGSLVGPSNCHMPNSGTLQYRTIGIERVPTAPYGTWTGSLEECNARCFGSEA